MLKQTFQAYAAEEAAHLANGEKRLAPEPVMERLTLPRRPLQELHRGENSRGLYRPAFRPGKKTIRYRLADVRRLEWETMQRH